VSGATIVPQGTGSVVNRPPADVVMRRLLHVPTGPPKVSEDSAHRLFSASILLSAFRCLLGYVFLPIITPILGATAGVGPILGIPIAVVALVFDVRGIRRFWLVDHRHRWAITALYLAVMGMVTYLLIRDVLRLV
jgi:hypothetical protein